MKKRYSLYAWLLLLCLCLGSCYKAPISTPPHTFENLITTQDVQYFSWRTFISNDMYVFASEHFEPPFEHGTTKYNLKTGSSTPVCLRPNCSHSNGAMSAYENDWCHIPILSKLYFTYENKIFLQYNTSDYPEDGQGIHTDIFAYYDFVTGEHKDLIKIRKNDYEQMYFSFIQHDGFIYYSRFISKSDKPATADDYALSLCRMQIGEYTEEVLFDLQAVCGTDRNQLWVPFAVDSNQIYLMASYTGKIAAVDLDNTHCRYLIDGSDGILVNFDYVFYHNGFIYTMIPAYAMDSSVPESVRNAFLLYRIDCNSGIKQKLTNDYIVWLFVSDQHVYYQMTPNLQPTKEQLQEAGNMDYSIHTIKQIRHDGSEPIKLQFTAPYSEIINGAWGGGDYLFLPMGYQKIESDGEGVMGQYTILLHVKTQKIITFEKIEGIN